LFPIYKARHWVCRCGKHCGGSADAGLAVSGPGKRSVTDRIGAITVANPAAANAPVTDQVKEAVTIPFYRPPAVPPLPFSRPMVGPVIKRPIIDDVNTRTTAFIPVADKFVPDFEMPDEDKWIRVDLSEQMLFAYESGVPTRAFIISSGLPRTPTVTGEFRIRVKVRSQTMSGGDPELGNDYSLPNVEWVQYFYEDYGFHGTYWHNNFGNPMSHGCVNMTNADAKWLFDWAGPTWAGERVWQRPTEDTLVIPRLGVAHWSLFTI
jgi:lipoprotein-anchoring transpeptidase ErfK/SrfK